MSQDCCSICLEALIPFSTNHCRPIGAASCGHCLHTECFQRWYESKSNPFFDGENEDSDYPCPVCNRPIQEFVRLYISGDKSENERLRKELKTVKRKLANERLRLQQVERHLKNSTMVFTSEDQPRSTSGPNLTRKPSAQTLGERFQRIEQRLERSEQPIRRNSLRVVSNQSKNNPERRHPSRGRQRSSRYRRHELCPLYSDTSSPLSTEPGVRRQREPSIPMEVPEESQEDELEEFRPDPPSPWSTECDDDDHKNVKNSDADADKLVSWIERMALAISLPTLNTAIRDVRSSFHPEDPPCHGQEQ